MPAVLTDQQLAVRAAITLKLAQLGLSAKPLDQISEGPIVSVYRFTPLGTTKVSHIEAVAQDVAIALGVEDVVVKRIPGEAAVSMFIPNKERRYVTWRDEVHDVATLQAVNKYKIPLWLGVDFLGRHVVEDLASFPHLLIAGSTGGGKSTLLSSLIATTFYFGPRCDVKFVLSDTKGVEFGHFLGAELLLFEPATSIYSTLERMDWLIQEMERRLKELGRYGHHNIIEYNNSSPRTPLTYICFIIDELADLLLDTRREEESKGPSLGKIAKGKLFQLAQKARATGIHIIASTQRPSVKLIDGDVKANFPARITFRLPSEADSRTVLGCAGAEHLLARGDMLFINPNKPGLQRIHAPWASVEDVKACVEYSARR